MGAQKEQGDGKCLASDSAFPAFSVFLRGSALVTKERLMYGIGDKSPPHPLTDTSQVMFWTSFEITL